MAVPVIYFAFFIGFVYLLFNILCGESNHTHYFCVQCHSGSVWRLSWAHPEFGEVLATCSFDRTVAIWEEQGELILIIQIFIALAVAEKKASLTSTYDTHWVSVPTLYSFIMYSI